MVNGLKLGWWESSMTLTGKLNKLWRSSCSPVCYLPQHCLTFPPHLDLRGEFMICPVTEMVLSAHSKVCSPEYPGTAFPSPKMLILLLPEGTSPTCLIGPFLCPFWTMELPRQVATAREVCLCKSHLDQECASFQKARKQEMDSNLTEMTNLQTWQNCLFGRWTN